MKTTTNESSSTQYRAYQQFSGLTADAFKSACDSLLHELADGEWAGEVWTPGQWLRAAREIAWVEKGRKNEKAYQALEIRTWK